MVLPVGQPGAPASSKVCLHGSFVGSCESVTLSQAHSMGEWKLDWRSLLTSASPTALHCGFFRDDDALECTEQFCC